MITCLLLPWAGISKQVYEAHREVVEEMHFKKISYVADKAIPWFTGYLETGGSLHNNQTIILEKNKDQEVIVTILKGDTEAVKQEGAKPIEIPFEIRITGTDLRHHVQVRRILHATYELKDGKIHVRLTGLYYG